MIEITSKLSIDESEIEEKFIHASGPGGQNINKVASAVQLRFFVDKSTSIPGDVKLRLRRLAGKLMNKEGQLVITARRYRTQEANRRDAMMRLIELIRRALVTPKKRVKTSPSKSSQLQRLAEKRHRGEKKKGRQQIRYLDEE
jgi:ribosome-associated protein